jgi:hypothetical protein
VSFAAITPCVASQRVFIVVSVYFVVDSVRKLLDTLVYFCNIKFLHIRHMFLLLIHKRLNEPFKPGTDPSRFREKAHCGPSSSFGAYGVNYSYVICN